MALSAKSLFCLCPPSARLGAQAIRAEETAATAEREEAMARTGDESEGMEELVVARA